MRNVTKFMIIPVVVLLLTQAVTAVAQHGSAGADWFYHSGDAGGTKYSPLDQINASNVSKLKIAWRWKSLNYGGCATPTLWIGGIGLRIA